MRIKGVAKGFCKAGSSFMNRVCWASSCPVVNRGTESEVPATLLGDLAKSICSHGTGKVCDSLGEQPGHGILALRPGYKDESRMQGKEPW